MLITKKKVFDEIHFMRKETTQHNREEITSNNKDHM
jgi:hypothetical protein